MKKIGFTGSRIGMTYQQSLAFTNVIRDNRPYEFHHGQCIGADYEAHYLVLTTLESSVRVVVHPPINKTFVADCQNAHEIKKALPYLKRNHAIVDSCEFLIACPSSKKESQRSGTWTTIRYAKKIGKDYLIIWPDGSTHR